MVFELLIDGDIRILSLDRLNGDLPVVFSLSKVQMDLLVFVIDFLTCN